LKPLRFYKPLINSAAGLFGARVVSADWGPRGVQATLRRAVARGFAPALVFDIGASDGRWTQECLDVLPRARYLLVDPLERNRPALEALCARNAAITAFFGVAGARGGHLTIHEHGDQSSVLASEEFAGTPRSVPATTVDDLFDTLGRPAPVLLKADVQGYELDVVKGASRCLSHCEMLILEVSFRQIYEDGPLAHDVIAYVAERGFRIFDICSYLQRPADRDLLQSDLVFVHESSQLLRAHPPR
jgi:FkbM family methyltransferase